MYIYACHDCSLLPSLKSSLKWIFISSFCSTQVNWYSAIEAISCLWIKSFQIKWFIVQQRIELITLCNININNLQNYKWAYLKKMNEPVIGWMLDLVSRFSIGIINRSNDWNANQKNRITWRFFFTTRTGWEWKKNVNGQ